MVNRWTRRRNQIAERAKLHEQQDAAAREQCNGTSNVVVSIAIGTETPTCDWVDALLENARSFLSRTSHVVLHLSRELSCSLRDIARWDATEDMKVAVNPVRLPTRAGHGSILYAHLLNVQFATKRWDGCCCYAVLQASNMLWLRRGMEIQVEHVRCSVGREGWRQPNAEMPLLISGYRSGTAGDEITARFYLNLTRTHYPMHAREIFAQRSRQPAHVRGESGRHAWSYHEGSFYPLATVLRFLRHLELTLTAQQILNASNSPEEWWLQAWSLNREPPTTPVQLTSQQLCLRLNVSQNGSSVQPRYVQKVRDDLMCPQALGSYRYYALKRFVRNASNKLTAQVLRLSRERSTLQRPHASPSSAECKRAAADRRRLP